MNRVYSEPHRAPARPRQYQRLVPNLYYGPARLLGAVRAETRGGTGLDRGGAGGSVHRRAEGAAEGLERQLIAERECAGRSKGRHAGKRRGSRTPLYRLFQPFLSSWLYAADAECVARRLRAVRAV